MWTLNGMNTNLAILGTKSCSCFPENTILVILRRVQTRIEESPKIVNVEIGICQESNPSHRKSEQEIPGLLSIHSVMEAFIQHWQIHLHVARYSSSNIKSRKSKKYQISLKIFPIVNDFIRTQFILLKKTYEIW